MNAQKNRLRQLGELMGSRASFTRLIVITVVIIAIFSLAQPRIFLSVSNLQFLALSTPELALLSLAIALAMLTGGIDLSVVATANIAGIVAALVLRGGDGGIGMLALACALGLLAGVACGIVNGLIIADLGVTPILATLGTSQLFAGIGLVLTGGSVITGLPAEFGAVAAATVAGIPVIFVIMLAVAAVLALVVAKTAFGMRMRMLGAGPTAARFSGIKDRRVLILTYGTSALIAGVAGLIITARASGANSEYGSSYILLAIVVAVLAGVNPDGGYMTVAGVVISALALEVLSAGLLSLGVSSHVVRIAQGALLILMMALNHYGGRISAWFGTLRGPRRTVPA